VYYNVCVCVCVIGWPLLRERGCSGESSCVHRVKAVPPMPTEDLMLSY